MTFYDETNIPDKAEWIIDSQGTVGRRHLPGLLGGLNTAVVNLWWRFEGRFPV